MKGAARWKEYQEEKEKKAKYTDEPEKQKYAREFVKRDAPEPQRFYVLKIMNGMEEDSQFWNKQVSGFRLASDG